MYRFSFTTGSLQTCTLLLSGAQDLVCSTKMVFVRIDDEGAPVPISERVKKRYNDRVKQFGRGLLTPEEMIIERSKKKEDK